MMKNIDALKLDKRHMIILFNGEIFATVWFSHFFQSPTVFGMYFPVEM